jgi:glyoxylase-like metal-dependent hydrolase (beta-lactamase superfamily II)
MGWFSRQRLDVLAFLIEHPSQGLVLFNTGLAEELARNPRRFAGPLLGLLARPRLAEGQSLHSQIAALGFSADDVRHIVLSDLRFYHTGGLASFAAAEVVVSRTEYDLAQVSRSPLYRRQDYDRIGRWRFVTYPGDKPLGTFPTHEDLLGDGSLLLIDTAGATAGSQALLVRLPSGPALLCGSLAPTRASVRYALVPLLLFDREAWWENLWRLKKLAELAPELTIVPDHDLEALTDREGPDFAVHRFEAADKEAEKES